MKELVGYQILTDILSDTGSKELNQITNENIKDPSSIAICSYILGYMYGKQAERKKKANKVNPVNKVTTVYDGYKGYYVNAINELMQDCNDIELLDLIKTLLYKSLQEREGATA